MPTTRPMDEILADVVEHGGDPSGDGPGGPGDARAAPAIEAPAGPAALATFGLGVSFGGIRAVDGVEPHDGPREIVGLIGPNGAGKTTLFDLISGFTPPTAAACCWAVTTSPALAPDRRARQGLGRSFQDGRLFPALTVDETLAVSLERWVEVRDPFTAALRLPASYDAEEKVRRRGSTN